MNSAYKAVKENKPELLAQLIAEGADVDEHPRGYHTPLGLAVAKRNIVCMKILLDAGANAHIQGPGPAESFHDTFTPLEEAIYRGYNDIFNMLLPYGTRRTPEALLKLCMGNSRVNEEMIISILELGVDLRNRGREFVGNACFDNIRKIIRDAIPDEEPVLSTLRPPSQVSSAWSEIHIDDSITEPGIAPPKSPRPS